MIFASWFLWKKENPYEYKNIKNVALIYWETKTAEILVGIASCFL